MSSDSIAKANTFHYTNKKGYDAIRSQPDWTFKASDPKLRRRPAGVYFTEIEPTERNLRSLCAKLGLIREKTTHVFWFDGCDGLVKLNDGRGRDRYILYSKDDYVVSRKDGRQRKSGTADHVAEEFQ